MRPILLALVTLGCNSEPPCCDDSGDTDTGSGDTAPEAWFPEDMPSFDASTGVIHTGGGDAVGAYPPGDGGDVLLRIGFDVGSDFTRGTAHLQVDVDTETSLLGGRHDYRHCTIDGTLQIVGDAELFCAGHFRVAPGASVIARDGRRGASLTVHVQGTFAIDGLVDLSAENGEALTDSPGLPGGDFTLQTTEPRTVAIPTIVTRGGDANLWEAGAPGGNVEVRVAALGEAREVTLSGARSTDPLFPDNRIHSRGPSFGPSTGCVPNCTPGWFELAPEGFRGGILTAGGAGGDAEDTESVPAEDGGRGGRGGAITVDVRPPNTVRFHHVDLLTGSPVESVAVYWAWDFGIGLAAFSRTGGMGGGGGQSIGADGGDGGDGGAAGAIAISAARVQAVEETEARAFAWDGCGSIVDLADGGAIVVGTGEDPEDPIYRISAAGGWGGVLGASQATYPSEDYPPRFGAKGAEGDVTVEWLE